MMVDIIIYNNNIVIKLRYNSLLFYNYIYEILDYTSLRYII